MKDGSPGDRLQRMIAGLGAPYGLERSCKIRHGQILTDRFLMSLSAEHVGGSLMPLLQDLALPRSATERVLSDFRHAQFVHFGHEADPEGDLTKVYLEFPLPSEGELLHHAFKWRIGSPTFEETFYRYLGRRSSREIADLINLALTEADSCRDSLHALLAKDPLRGADAIMLLEVTDGGSSRRSFDLNLYPFGITLTSMPAALDALKRAFGLDPQTDARLAAAVGPSDLGHIAFGRDRRDAEFVTLYYGLEER